MRWWVSANRLSLTQRAILDGMTDKLDESHWVKGFAGTGKTVVLAHLIERIISLNSALSNANRYCFITFTHALVDLVRSGLYGDHVLQNLEIMTHTRFLGLGRRYSHVFLDEVQDISVADLERISNLADNLYVAGDPDQRIYQNRASDEDISGILAPHEHHLVEIFRLTEPLRRVALSILPGATIVNGLRASSSAASSIRCVGAVDEATEVEWVYREALKRARAGDPSVILFPMHKNVERFASVLAEILEVESPASISFVRGRPDYEPFNDHWENLDIPFRYQGNSFGSLPESDTSPIIYAMTFHSSKGLDFKNVFIPGMNRAANIVSTSVLKELPDHDRRLLFVAATRAREGLFFTFSGEHAHRFIDDIRALDCVASATVDSSDLEFEPDDEDFF